MSHPNNATQIPFIYSNSSSVDMEPSYTRKPLNISIIFATVWFYISVAGNIAFMHPDQKHKMADHIESRGRERERQTER